MNMNVLTTAQLAQYGNWIKMGDLLYDGSSGLSFENTRPPTSTTDKEEDMQTPRNAYELWVIDEDDDVETYRIVADTPEGARDLLIAENFTGESIRNVEIVLAKTVALKPRRD